MFKVTCKNLLQSAFGKIDFRLVRISNGKIRPGTNLNVGCGEYEISGFISVDFYTKHYYQSGNFKRTHYDMRNDELPFVTNSVDAIYCLHVIEHIETNYVYQFLKESYRVLKSKGVLRLACPDSFFLYKAMKEFPEYYSWHPMYQSPEDAVKCFIDEVATHRSNLTNYGLSDQIANFDYGILMELLREGGNFNEKNPGCHINNWDYVRLRKYALAAGFDTVIESRYKGSCCPSLQGTDMDLTHPEMSLFADLLKN